MEARELDGDLKAKALISEIGDKFHFIDYTTHPSDINGEAPGKSSNVAWAARKSSERYSSNEARDDVIITIIDADSHLSANYFSLVTTMALAYPETSSTTIYAAPIIFDRNSHIVPVLVRVADILWGAAGISGLYDSSTIRPPTSVYSLPLSLVDKVGGWDTDAAAIGEDLHMYLKCFFALNGNLTQRTILAPVSQTNVSSQLRGVRGSFDGHKARYKQALRHMWGAFDSGYALRHSARLWKQRSLMGRSYQHLHLNGDWEHKEKYSEMTSSSSSLTQYEVSPPNWLRIFSLFHRLFEAHFLPTHMAILAVTTTAYLFINPAAPSPHMSFIFQLNAHLRIIGFLAVAFYMRLYESYHSICVRSRENEMKEAGFYEDMKESFSKRHWSVNWIDYVLIPAVAPFFGSIPASQAQISHIWTDKLVYAVSQKPLRETSTREFQA